MPVYNMPYCYFFAIIDFILRLERGNTCATRQQGTMSVREIRFDADIGGQDHSKRSPNQNRRLDLVDLRFLAFPFSLLVCLSVHIV